jgi:hypothetical protein
MERTNTKESQISPSMGVYHAHRRKVNGIILAMVTIIVPYLIMLSNPHVESSQSLCPFMLLTGLPCPGCGITKSIIYLYKGDIMGSLGYHIFGPLVVLFCILSVGVLTMEIITGREYLNKLYFNRRVAYLLGAVLASWHVTRLILFIAHHSIHEILRGSIWG